MEPSDSDNPNPPSSRPSPLGWIPPAVDDLDALIPDRYEVLELLGAGGMAAVYKARQVRLDRLVAIKILPPDSLGDDDEFNFTERFEQEARAMGNLSHPGIVGVYDFGETATGLHYFVMEYIDGTDIVAYLNSHGGSLPEDYALSITAHVLDALAYAHDHGVIHRDIKPANVLINSEGQIKIADFGLAKHSAAAADSGLTQTNMAMGTPDFVAPEALISGAPVDHRADLYAVGVMLYQMLTGELPRGRFQLPSEKIPALDARIDPLIGKSMASEPASRYQSASEMRGALDALFTAPIAKVTQGAPSTAIPTGPGKVLLLPKTDAAKEPGQSPSEHELPVANPTKGRSPALIAGAIIAPLLLIGVGLFFWLNAGNDDPALNGSAEPATSTTIVAKTSPKPKPALAEEPAPAEKPTIAPTTIAEEKPAPEPAPTAAPVPTPTPAPSDVPAKSAPPVSLSQTPSPPDPKAVSVDEPPQPAGKLHTWGNGPANTPPDLGDAAAQSDFVQVAVNKHGWAALRQVGEIYLTAWGMTDGRYTGRPTFIKRFNASFMFRGYHIALRESTSGNLRNLFIGGSQTRADLAHPDATAVLEPNGHLTAIDAEGRLLISHSWGNTTDNNPPDDFFLGAPAFTATADYYIAARPGLPVRSWNVGAGAIADFPDNIRDVVAMDAAIAQVILLDASGKVFVRDPSGAPLPSDIAFLEPPADLPPAIAVRSGRRMCAAQVDGGYWIAWGESPELAKQAAKIGPALDIDLHYEKDVSEFLIWIESTDPSVFPTRITSAPASPPASSPFPADITERLAKIDAQYQKAYDRDIAPGHTKAITALDKNYLAAVKRALTAAAKAGKLEESVALRNEVQRLENSQALPPLDLDSLPGSLKKLRKTYRDTLAGLESDRAKKAAPYEARRDELYQAYQTELTKAGRIDDALAIKERRTNKPTATPSPSTPPAAPPSASAPAPPATPGDIQPILDWVFRVGGTVALTKDGKKISVTQPSELPFPPFEITGINADTRTTTEITDRDLASITAISTLRTLRVANDRVTIRRLEPLASHPLLEYLHIGGSNAPIREDEIAHLAGLTELTYLNLHFEKSTGEGLVHLRGATKLTQLIVTSGEAGSLTLTGAQAIAQFPALQKLTLAKTVDRKNQEVLAPIAKIGTLTELSLVGAIVIPEGFSHIAEHPTLPTLDLSYCDVDNRGFAFLAPLAPSLTDLRMSYGTNLTDKGVQALVTALPNLEKISLPETSTCTGDSLRELAKLPELRIITCFVKNLKPADYRLLADIPAIEQIILYNSSITDEGLDAFSKCKHLTNLSLANTSITDKAFAHFQAIAPLRKLNLTKTKVTPAGLAAFKKARPEVEITH